MLQNDDQSDIDYSVSPGDLQPLEMIGEQGDALRGRYIRRLTAVIIHHVPAFWKVSVSVFSGKFAKVTRLSYPLYSIPQVGPNILRIRLRYPLSSTKSVRTT